MKFSIRDALWLTALVAVALSWWIERARREEAPSPQPAEGQGKYDVIMTGERHDKPYLFDSKTGEMWERYSDGQWSPFAEFPGK